MSVVAVGSVHGSPGATTLALDLAALDPEATLVIEADPDGGRLAARLDLALRPGLTELAGSARTNISSDDLWRFAQGAPGVTPVVVAHPAAEQVTSVLRVGGHHIGQALRDVAESTRRHVVLDIGRVRPGSPSLALMAAADHVVVLVENTMEAAVALAHRAALLGAMANVHVVLNRARPYSAREIEAACGRTVWGVVPNATSTTSRRPASRRRRRAVGELHAQLFDASRARHEVTA